MHRWQSKSHSNEERRGVALSQGPPKSETILGIHAGVRDAARVIILGRAISWPGDDNNNLNRGHLAYVQFGAYDDSVLSSAA